MTFFSINNAPKNMVPKLLDKILGKKIPSTKIFRLIKDSNFSKKIA
jgi:hypothetical protein